MATDHDWPPTLHRDFRAVKSLNMADDDDLFDDVDPDPVFVSSLSQAACIREQRSLGVSIY
jgi:hypothetical protein